MAESFDFDNDITNLDQLENSLAQVDVLGDTPYGTETAGPEETAGGVWETSGYTSSFDRPVATVEDYLDYGRYLNQCLSVHGIPHPYPGHIDFDFPEDRHKVQVVNTLLELVQNEQRQKQFIFEANDMIKALQTELRDSTMRWRARETEYKQLKDDYDTLKQKQNSTKTQYERKQKVQKQKSQKLQKDFEALKFKDKHYQAELRSKDQQIMALRKKYSARISDQEKGARVALGMKSPISADPPKRNRRDEEICILEQKLQTLTELCDQNQAKVDNLTTENSKIRDSYLQMQLELKEKLGDAGDFMADEDFEENHKGTIENMDMPFDIVRQDVEGEILSDIEHIRQQREEQREERKKLDQRKGNPNQLGVDEGDKMEEDLGTRRGPSHRKGEPSYADGSFLKNNSDYLNPRYDDMDDMSGGSPRSTDELAQLPDIDIDAEFEDLDLDSPNV